jgi:hypothetical protein
MSTSIAFLICTEAGPIEDYSLLLVESIRKFGGSLKDAPIYSFEVRNTPEISQKTSKALKALDVVHVREFLNNKYPDFAFANQPCLGTWAEENLDADILVLLDSDQILFNEPEEFLLPSEYDIGVRPVFIKNVGSEGQNDPNEEYWQKLYEIVGTKNNMFVTSTVDQKNIRAYWNGGLVVVKRNLGLFSNWKNNLEKVMESKIQPRNGGIFYVSQTTMAATICAMTEKVWTLSPQYNYPISLHNRVPESEQIRSFDNLVSIHYTNSNKFRDNGLDKSLASLNNLDRSSQKYKWLFEYLAKHWTASNGMPT